MLHFVIIACFLLLLISIAAWILMYRRFQRLLVREQPALADALQASGRGYLVSGKTIEFCLQRKHRELGNSDLEKAGDSLARAHQLLTPLITGLLILVALLIIFSSDPGDPEDYLFWP